MADVARFWAKVALPNEQGCMLWLASKKPNGYGQLSVGGRADKRTVFAHRYSYELAYGSIPQGLHIDHLCGVRHCVAPLHLEAVTQPENNRRADGAWYQRAKTHCPRNHPYAGENLYVCPKGRRNCRTCHRMRRRKREDVTA